MTEVLYDVADHVATITLNAPERMNTISGTMLSMISARLLEADRDPAARCIVLTGEGRAFCAGLDLQAQMAGPKGGLGNLGGPQSFTGEFELRDAPPIVLHTIDTPTVCALNGGAAGYGLDLALGCDIRIAAETAKLNLRAAFTMPWDKAIEYERDLQAICFATDDAREGRAAFAGKRAPDFKRR